MFTAADLGLEAEPAPFNPTVTRGMLAIDKVRFVGEPIAVVVTEDRQPGRGRGRGTSIVDYDVLPGAGRPRGGDDRRPR